MKNNKDKTKKIKKKKSKFVSILQYIIIIAMVAFNILFVSKAIKNPNKTPDLFGIKTFVIISGSMEPNINIGDMVIVKIADEPYMVGDIIAFREGNTVIVHRIVKKIDEDGKIKYQTKGDNNNAVDKNLVEENRIEGVYKFKIPMVGNVFMFIYKNFVIIIIILLIIMIYKLLR